MGDLTRGRPSAARPHRRLTHPAGREARVRRSRNPPPPTRMRCESHRSTLCDNEWHHRSGLFPEAYRDVFRA